MSSRSKISRNKRQRVGRDARAADAESIPIPSFTSTVSSSSPSSHGSNDLVEVRTSISQLVKAEGALQVHLMRQRRMKRIASLNHVPLQDFYVMARKLKLAETAQEGRPKTQNTDTFSKEERLLCDMVCIGTPSLYRLFQQDESDALSKKSKSSWCLELVPFDGKRMEELKRLASRPQVHEDEKRFIANAIESHREASQPKPHEPSNQKSSARTAKLGDEPTILPGMTLEERVQARADVRLTRQKQQQQVNQEGAVDKTVLLAMADAIWSHTRHLLNRQDQLGSSTRSIFQSDQKASKHRSHQERSCIMTLEDVMKAFSRTQSKDSKTKKKQMIKALQELERVVPGWIQIQDDQQEQSGRLSMHATVWIKPQEYQAIRFQISGTDGSNVPTRKPPIALGHSPKSASVHRRATTLADGPRLEEIPVPRGVARVSLSPSIDAKRRFKAEKAPEVFPRAHKRSRTLVSTALSSEMHAEGTSSRAGPHVSGTKRPAAGEILRGMHSQKASWPSHQPKSHSFGRRS